MDQGSGNCSAAAPSFELASYSRERQLASGSMPLNRCMSLSIPCCGEVRREQRGPWKCVEMGCTSLAAEFLLQANLGSRLLQAPGLCTASWCQPTMLW